METRPLSLPALALTFALALLACVTQEIQSLPPAPSDLATGIAVYMHDNYRGGSAHITHNVSDLKSFEGPCEDPSPWDTEDSEPKYDWSDCISSVRVAPGWRATLYKDSKYESDSILITTDVPNLEKMHRSCSRGFGDCVSSIRVEKIAE